MYHMFNVKVAEKYGIEEAILFQNIAHWVEVNRSRESNFINGRYWTFNTANGFRKIFPYMSAKKIQRVLKKLEECGLIITGNYNETPYNRTKWYTLSDIGESVAFDDCNGQDLPFEKTKMSNENGQKCPIYINNNIDNNLLNTNINTDINTYIKGGESIKAIVEYLNQVCGTNYRYQSAKTQSLIKARLKEGFSLDDFRSVIDKKFAEWGNNPEMSNYLRPETLFGTKFESYLNQKSTGRKKSLSEEVDEWFLQRQASKKS